MNEPEISYGIVGFFDILGYTSFLENNDPEEAAKIVTGILLQLQDSLGEYHKELFPRKDEEELLGAFKRIKSLVFSDTILLTLSYPDNADPGTKGWFWLAFLGNAALLYRHLFDSGLPIRGAIACGRYLVQGTCFAGRNIIEAYRVAQQLDLAGVVLAQSAASEMERLKEPMRLATSYSMIQRYRVPLKGAKSADWFMLSPCLPKIPKQKLPLDVRQYVAEAFWQHNKDLPPEEIKKIENTELYLRFFRMKLPYLFVDEQHA